MEKQKRQLFHFTAEWCGPCQTMKPDIEAFVKENPDIEYVKVDVDNDADTFKEYAEKYEFESTPSMIAMVDGLLHRARRGSSTKEQLLALFD